MVKGAAAEELGHTELLHEALVGGQGEVDKIVGEAADDFQLGEVRKGVLMDLEEVSGDDEGGDDAGDGVEAQGHDGAVALGKTVEGLVTT